MLLEPRPTRFDLNWRMFGVPTRITIWHWIASFIMARPGENKLDAVLVWIACVFVSILIHEFGHALTARFFGAAGVRVVLYHFGGLAIYDRGLPKRWQEVAVLLMGPGAGFLLFGVVLAIGWAGDWPTWPYLAQHAYFDLWWINLVWGLVNLIPVYPLDGGQILKVLLTGWRPFEGYRMAHTACMYIGMATAAIFVFAHFFYASPFGLFPAILFAGLAYLNYMFRKPEYEAAEKERHYAEEPRQPWEQDADWWKR